MDLDALLDRAEAARADSWEDAQIVLAGEVFTIAVARVDGTTWVELKAAHHPRTAEDARRGYDSHAISRAYPRTRVQGIDIAPDAWTRLYEALDTDNQQTIDALIWGVNVHAPQRARLQALAEAAPTPPATET